MLADEVEEFLRLLEQRTQELDAVQAERDDLSAILGRADKNALAWQKRVRELEKERDDVRRLTKHLFEMIDQETWRATGGDDGQGHYEGDYHAEQIALMIREWKDIASQ